MNILETYLLFLENDSLDTFLKDFKQVISYHDPKEIKIGLLKYKEKPEKGIAFLFELPKEEIANFHTIGMHFKIDIFFYDHNKNLDSCYLNVKPGIKSIKSKHKVKYVIEIPK
mgnify:CR=1 FL=1